MAVRMTGLISNLDTEALIGELMKAQSQKKVKLEQSKTKLEWKEEKWKDINTKLYALYNEKLSKIRLQGNYMTKAASSSNEAKVSVSASNKAAAGSYTLEVNQMASSQYVTGSDMKEKGWSTSTKLTAIFGSAEEGGEAAGLAVGTQFTVRTGKDLDKVSTFTVTETSTIASFTSFLSGAGLNASFDAGQGRFFIGSASTGEEGRFTLTSGVVSAQETAAREQIREALGYDDLSAEDKKAADKAMSTIADSTDEAALAEAAETLDRLAEKYEREAYAGDLSAAVGSLADAPEPTPTAAGEGLDALGLGEITEELAANGQSGSGMSVRVAKDSEIVFNGATLSGSSNNFSINGLNFDINGKTEAGEIITLSVRNDTQASYDMIKDFVTSYNEILKTMTEGYYAKSAKGYSMLTKEEKEAMTEDEVKLWEDKIKGALLRSDTRLETVIAGMRSALQTSVEVDGKKYSLASFGIVTGNYDEYGLLHIEGDKDDGKYAEKSDKLLAAFNGDSGKTAEVLTKIFGKLYDKMADMMKTNTLSSAMTFYNDKEIKKQYDEYDDQIDEWEERLADMEDSYYKQFSAMEVSLQKLQQQQNQLAGMLGTPQK